MRRHLVQVLVCAWLLGQAAILAGGAAATDESLMRDLGAVNADVASAAVSQLAARGDGAIPMVAKALPRESVRFRRNAVAVFAATRGDEAGQALATVATSDPSPSVRDAAATALRQTHPEAARRFLVPLSLDTALPETRRRLAIDLIRAVGDKACIAALVDAMEEQDARSPRRVTSGMDINVSGTRFAGYDRSNDVTYKIPSGKGTQTVVQNTGMPIIDTVSVQTKVMVSAGSVLSALTGQSLGNQPGKWRAWWSRNQATFSFPAPTRP